MDGHPDYQCGGINWTGATACEAGSYCKEQNPFYHQCVAVDGNTYPSATATGSDVDYINTLLASGTPSAARPTTLVTIIASSATAPTVTPTAAADDDDDDYCEDEAPTPAAATPTSAAGDDGDDYCEEEETATVTLASRPTGSAAAANAAAEEDDYCEE